MKVIHLDAPEVGGLVQRVLHHAGDGLPLGQDLGEVAGPEHVPQRGGRQQPRRVRVVLDIVGGLTEII